MSIKPFIKIRNIPKVTIVIGKLMKTNIGFIRVLTIPRTIENKIAVPKFLT